MDRITIGELRTLALLEPKPRLTMYLPTSAGAPAGSPEGRQDEILLRNLADSAEQQFQDAGVRPAVGREMVEQIRQLPARPRFWQERRNGLAVFVAEDTCLTLRLSTTFAECVTVGPRFLLKPILAHLLSDHPFLLLALSRNQVQLFRGNREVLERIRVPKMPQNIDEALQIDSADRGEQVRSIRRGDGGKDDAIFHGQGGKPETHKEDFAHYVVILLQSLQPVLEQENDPLLLAGVEYELEMFRRACTYPHILDTLLLGNADKLSNHELHKRAWEHLVSGVDKQQAEAITRYRSDAGKRTTSRKLAEVVVAAPRGDIDLLFVDNAKKCWGRYDVQTETLEEHARHEPMDDELLDFVTLQTWLARGTTLILPSKKMPETTGLAASYRRGRILQSAKKLAMAATSSKDPRRNGDGQRESDRHARFRPK